MKSASGQIRYGGNCASDASFELSAGTDGCSGYDSWQLAWNDDNGTSFAQTWNGLDGCSGVCECDGGVAETENPPAPLFNVDTSGGDLNWTVYAYFTNSKACTGNGCYTNTSYIVSANTDYYYYYCNTY